MTPVLTSDWPAQVRAAGLHRRQVRGRRHRGPGRGQERRAREAAGGRGGGAEAGGGAAGGEGGAGGGVQPQSAAGHDGRRQHRLRRDVRSLRRMKLPKQDKRSTKKSMNHFIINKKYLLDLT